VNALLVEASNTNAVWESRKLSEVASIVNGGTPKSKVAEFWNGSHQWLTPADMGKMEEREIGATPRTITDQGLARSSARLVPPKSVILSTRAPIGHLAINSVPMAFNQGCRGLVPGEKLDHVFLYYFLQANRDLLNNLGTGKTFKELSATNLKSVEIPLPPLEEQKRIVAVLDQAFATLDRARANAEANLADAEELFERIQSRLMFQLSIEAPTAKMKELVSFLNGDRGKNYPNKSEYVTTGISWINTGHILPDGTLSDEKMNFITETKFEQLGGGKTKAGDLVFCLRGATIGKTALVGHHVPGAVASSLMIIRPGPRVMDKFVYYFLTSELGRNEIARFIGGAAQPNLAGKSVGQFDVPVVAIERQRELVAKLDNARMSCFKMSKEMKAKIADLDDLRQSILQKAFAGELA